MSACLSVCLYVCMYVCPQGYKVLVRAVIAILVLNKNKIQVRTLRAGSYKCRTRGMSCEAHTIGVPVRVHHCLFVASADWNEHNIRKWE